MENNKKQPENKENIFSDASSQSKSPSIIKSPRSDHSNNSRRNRSRSLSRRSSKEREEERKFIMKNGCCKDCMRAFSSTGKSCLCQVPKYERKYTLSEKGCNFCGCHGCNPIDVRREKRRDLKRQLKDDKNLLYKNERLLDSDDEELKINIKEVDGWNIKKKDLLIHLMNTYKSHPYFMGFGTPIRSPGYILGYPPSKEKKSRQRGSYRQRKEDDDL